MKRLVLAGLAACSNSFSNPTHATADGSTAVDTARAIDAAAT